MKIYKSKTSTFTFAKYPDGKQVCLVVGGVNKNQEDSFLEVGQVCSVDESYITRHFTEITFQSYLNEVENDLVTTRIVSK